MQRVLTLVLLIKKDYPRVADTEEFQSLEALLWELCRRLLEPVPPDVAKAIGELGRAIRLLDEDIPPLPGGDCEVILGRHPVPSA
jgi:hypothetical protein